MSTESVKVNIGGVEMELANYTPHDITIYKLDGKTPAVTVPKTGVFIRVAELVTPIIEGEVSLLRVERDSQSIEGLPDKVDGRVLIVSDITYQAARALGRDDVVRTGPAVRDSAGNIIGCKGLAV